jgi:hypothetical protein
MAINKRFTQLNNSGSNHNLLDALSGKLTGSLEVTGSAYFPGGLSGSLQMLTDGTTMFLTGAGSIVITNLANGQIEISGSTAAGAASPQYWDSTTAASIYTTGSVLIRSDDGSLTDSASDYGTDTFFFVSGAIDGVINGDGVAAFGGDVVVSGNLYISGVNSANANYPSGLYVYGPGTIYGTLTVGDALDPDVAYFNSQLTASAGINTPIIGSAGGSVTVIAPLTASVGLDLSGNSVFQAGSTFTFNGNGVFAAGLTGSLQEVSAGVPYLLAGDYITLATNSLGQIAISASNLPGTEVYWQSTVANNIFTTGSIAVTGSAIISSSLTVNPAGTGRGLLRVGGLDIGPITGSLQMNYTGLGTETGVIGGSVLSASNGVWDGTNPVVLRHELHVLGLGVDDGLLPVETFAATYLVMTYIDSSGVQTVKAVTELSRETSGSRAATYDINFAPNGNIEATGSVPANYSAYIAWYAQRVKEMSLSYDISIT